MICHDDEEDDGGGNDDIGYGYDDDNGVSSGSGQVLCIFKHIWVGAGILAISCQMMAGRLANMVIPGWSTFKLSGFGLHC